MPKNIVLLCDGTSNEIARNRTNILRLYGCLKKGREQLVFYDPGVGTFGAENSWSYFVRKAVEIWGLITGWGIDRNVKEAYQFLVENYDDGRREDGPSQDPDRIYIFGFSRGAYTARMLAGFIHNIGLIDDRNLNLLNYAYTAYNNIGKSTGRDETDAREPEKNPFAEVRLFERMLRPRRPVITALGLFDTVGSVIEWTKLIPRIRSQENTSSNPSVAAVRHAVGLDERRTMFLPSLWPAGGEFVEGSKQQEARTAAVLQDVKEVWFSGVHGDVGGGYAERRSQLAKLPLQWMIEETRALGLAYDDDAINTLVLGQDSEGRYVSPESTASPNRSMNWAWAILEFVPRFKTPYCLSKRRSFLGVYLPFFERRYVPPGAAIHASVFERRGKSTDYDQPNIPDDHTVI